ncbi:MAG: LLM class flavin-dependent oxidoreductase [Rhodobacteraceae bacterium]|nr:LLM class flavin-dependent oxidoreductase [Paracoccaceae bacterium]
MSHLFPQSFSCVVIGDESLTVQCCDVMLQRGHRIEVVVSNRAETLAWAQERGLRTETPGKDLAAHLKDLSFDWLFSVANLMVIPKPVLEMATRGAINFHDGPLPHYAGLNTPAWAVINREKQHGITWHLIEGGIDEGDILEQRIFDVSDDETALSLNTKCFEAAVESFEPLLESVETKTLQRVPQNLSGRRYFGRSDRPAAAGHLDFSRSAEELVALVQGLDHGNYWNPLCCPKIAVDGVTYLVGEARIDDAQSGPSATILSCDAEEMVVGTQTKAIRLSGLCDCIGTPVEPNAFCAPEAVLESPSKEETDRINVQVSAAAKADGFWHKRLIDLQPVELSSGGKPRADSSIVHHDLIIPNSLSRGDRFVATAGWAATIAGRDEFDLALQTENPVPGYINDWVPVRFGSGLFGQAAQVFAKGLTEARNRGAFACDIAARDKTIDLSRCPDVALSEIPEAGLVVGSCITVNVADAKLHVDTARVEAANVTWIAGQLDHLMAAIADKGCDDVPVQELPVLSDAERDQVLFGWNETTADYDKSACVHQLFEAQALETPDKTALVFEDHSLTYAELNARANRVAHVLRDMGVGLDIPVGLFTRRSLDMVIGALAIQKAGGAYVPLDPTYPKNRLAHFISDSGAPVIVSQSELIAELPDHQANVLEIDNDTRIEAAPDVDFDSGVTPENLAYLIYTSGSTGVPKGVMVEHRNVANFFTGMDKRVNRDPAGVWLAVTSISFDISVLELFYTLARGFKVVLNSDESRVMASNAPVMISDQKMEFSLYNWGNDGVVGADKYELMIEGAKFADKNGFCAVWTPERHFHAFGGSYPNPAVTGAAIASITKNLAVRAGSIVAPLHHPIRIAEEWAVIDNLTQGRVGLGMASGWHPHDFVLRPENTPPNNKPAMFEAIKTVRRLWGGEPVEFPDKDGKPVAVVTQPRPISKHIPIWVTIAGNPETWKEAGEVGANVLTHLLGQSIAEVEEKTAIYHEALRAAGHDPQGFTVTLMLHTYVADDRETARETARDAMKNYMRSAAGLIKQFAWSFPAFKRPKGVSNPFQLDLEILTPEELEAILDFAFERYFEDSGLFGTVEDCLARVEQLKKIGVGEIACLVDYGLPVETVLKGLVPLAEVLKRANTATKPAKDDFSIAAQIARHNVTHLQCTPSMARMLVTDASASIALRSVKNLLIGGEPLPGSLVGELSDCTRATLENMYGPTETTIWSSSEPAVTTNGLVNIGTPITNTQLYVLDDEQTPLPVGVPGELYIGGAGVARGYWQRPEMTSEKFPTDPFCSQSGRMYRTGDLVCRRGDGKIEFLGRVDNQVKLRGHRIELGEIEACLETHSAISQAVVVTREMVPGDVRLVAYYVASSAVSESDLRRMLGASLPEYMKPSHYQKEDEMPLTPNKKVDRNALPELTKAASGEPASGYVAPDNSLEQQISAIWSRILGIHKIGSGDNFFDLGGHSLLAVQAHREIKSELGADRLSITDIFRFPTLSALASRLKDQIDPTAKAPAKTDSQMGNRIDAIARRRAMRAKRRAIS